ncbi:AAA family ATPase, partial [Streptomyces sp. DH24]|uniref:AAA family ATPase n=1 Tax=Streptomyces sp. DH24 TaxID=3040123 RepID=UPI0024433228
LETVPPGGIRVCAATRAGSERVIAYGPVAGPDGACEPLGTRPSGTPCPAPLLGRDRELEQLRGALGDMVRKQRPYLLTVLGEPGAGKSRLARELGRLARRTPGGCTVLTAHGSWCDRDRPLALLERTLAAATGTGPRDDRPGPSDGPAHGRPPLAGAGRPAARPSRGAPDGHRPPSPARPGPALTPDDALSRTVHALFGTGDRGTWLLDRLRPLLLDRPPAAPADWPGIAAAWRFFLAGLATERPLLLVLEDVHTVPDAVLDVVTDLAGAVGPVPLLVAVTARPELLDRRPAWGGGRRDALTLTLDPLDEPSSAALLDTLLGADGRDLPPELRRDVLARVGGNPLYAVEYARELTGADPGRHPAGPPPMPRHVRQVVAAHLDTLPPRAKAVLVDASALGGVCCADGVAAVGGGDRDDAARWLDYLERRDFLRRSRHTSADGAPRYAFRHPATREVVDSLVPRTVREDRGRRAAAWTERTAARRAL